MLWAKAMSGNFRRHFTEPLALSKATTLESAVLAIAQQEDHRILVENRTAAHRHVKTVRHNLFPPNDLSLEIQGRDDRGAEDAVDELAIGDGSGAGVAPAGAAAEVVPQPGTRRNDRVP